MKKLLALALALCLCASLAPSIAFAEDEAPTKIKFFRAAVEQDPTQDRLLLELQKRTNTEIEFLTAPWDGEATRITTILASGETCDIMSMNTNSFNFAQFCRDGLLLQLDDILATDNYPICKKLAYGDIYFRQYNVDGKVYGIPSPIQPGDWNNYIRSDWLANVDLAMPTTPDEMYEVLKAFKYNDPDQNGKDDTIGVYVAQKNSQLEPLYAMFQNGYNITVREKDGILEYIKATPEAKEAMTFINKLYHEGLINQDLFTINEKNYVRYQFSAGVSGWVTSPMIAGDYNELLAIDPDAKIELMSPLPHTENSIGAYASDSAWNWMNSVFPASCSNLDKAKELLEYLHSPEGRKLMCVGIEGIHYERYEEVDEVGIFYGISAEEQGKDWDPAKGEGPTGSPMWWGMSSTINGIVPYFEYESLEEALKHVTMFVAKEEYDNNPYWDMRKRGSWITNHNPMPNPVDGWLNVLSDITSVYEEYEAAIIMADPGQIDALWDEYLMALNSVGLQEGLAAAQEWYDSNQ